jgi:solute carrier family 35 protein F5
VDWSSRSFGCVVLLFHHLYVVYLFLRSSVLIQYIYDDLDFNSPFMITYLANTLLALYIPLWQLEIALGFIVNPPKLTNRCDITNSSITSGNQAVSSLHVQQNEDTYQLKVGINDVSGHCDSILGANSRTCFNGDAIDHNDIVNVPRRVELANSTSATTSYTHMDVAKAALIIAPLWFIANCLYNYSLYMTSVSSSTIISNLSASFTLAFSWHAGFEPISFVKIVGIVICFAGAVLVGVDDSDGGPNQTAWGDLVALLSALTYGMYTTVIRMKVPDDNGISMQLLLGYIGLVNGVLLAPVTLILVGNC